jgi:hypothetical protein
MGRNGETLLDPLERTNLTGSPEFFRIFKYFYYLIYLYTFRDAHSARLIRTGESSVSAKSRQARV